MFLPLRPHYSSHSDSPVADLTELQEDANLAANHMLSVKEVHRPQKTMGNFGFRGISACQTRAEEAVANERARVHHSKEVLNTKVGCTKAVMKAKYNYRMAIQEAKQLGATNFKSWK